ncbi:CDP-diacylglycerol--glycerol-3-phosphate 3-phosphatidyltransferase [Leadbettera azotonutricia]|uniref:CDP-diacylglycerol--glycerol-3-phosphate 3-phosphatidyltransferase n=1 Tax=Leadbettera azotonutricia (strain ATCC BAA-888 / DSM 13862 / ZAS-9) TaxID=545695 RepID=F5YER4_LEAAZ|nr:CDP-diacylglycerol--glycerol-3-phosphate 3-phosphatidyltransferase [Leadbettera azotonutricia]AEF82472.1 CDP-diacylglycerol--glycerol-3-phosphate 3-phosphatidyltransferase [Leadbettera azotonutricia ZAS-9]
MTLADKVTSLRLILAPLFFAIYLLPRFLPDAIGVSPLWIVIVLWFIFIISEFTDFLDGWLARKRGEVSDFGKLYDPFADTLTQLTYFFCFVVDGILPAILFLLVIYREFGILFIRNLMLRKGIALGARIGGKIKTVTYILAVACALLASSALRLGLEGSIYRVLATVACVIFLISVIISAISFFDYVSIYKNKK